VNFVVSFDDQHEFQLDWQEEKAEQQKEAFHDSRPPGQAAIL